MRKKVLVEVGVIKTGGGVCCSSWGSATHARHNPPLLGWLLVGVRGVPTRRPTGCTTVGRCYRYTSVGSLLLLSHTWSRYYPRSCDPGTLGCERGQDPPRVTLHWQILLHSRPWGLLPLRRDHTPPSAPPSPSHKVILGVSCIWRLFVWRNLD